MITGSRMFNIIKASDKIKSLILQNELYKHQEFVMELLIRYSLFDLTKEEAVLEFKDYIEKYESKK